MKTYVVETDALLHNVRTIRQKAGDAPVWAVVKGGGYGLGVADLAVQLRQGGISRFCVTELSEAKALRDAGMLQEPILMLRPVLEREVLDQLLDLNVILTVSGQDDAVLVNAVAKDRGTVAEVHVKVDTGMGRYGFLPNELDGIISVYAYMDALAVTGIYTHFSSAFCSEKKTLAQFEQFEYVVDQIAAKGYETGEPHCCNSSALMQYDGMTMDGVRVGSALLGRINGRGAKSLRRVGFCEASVDELKWLPKGHSCGYGAAWTAKKPTKIAVLGVGWYHGFGVEYGRDVFRIRDCLRGMLSYLKALLSRKKITVRLGEQRCKVLGHIGMLHTVVDVTNVPCNLGDRAIVDISPVFLRGMDVEFR